VTTLKDILSRMLKRADAMEKEEEKTTNTPLVFWRVPYHPIVCFTIIGSSEGGRWVLVTREGIKGGDTPVYIDLTVHHVLRKELSKFCTARPTAMNPDHVFVEGRRQETETRLPRYEWNFNLVEKPKPMTNIEIQLEWCKYIGDSPCK
jgi:hypothetical protein